MQLTNSNESKETENLAEPLVAVLIAESRGRSFGEL